MKAIAKLHVKRLTEVLVPCFMLFLLYDKWSDTLKHRQNKFLPLVLYLFVPNIFSRLVAGNNQRT